MTRPSSLFRLQGRISYVELPTKHWIIAGVETISHLRENGRITVMFNAFEGPPRIVRLFGHGERSRNSNMGTKLTLCFHSGTVHEFGTPEYEELIPAESRKPGSRAAIVIDVYKVGTVRYSPRILMHMIPKTTGCSPVVTPFHFTTTKPLAPPCSLFSRSRRKNKACMSTGRRRI